MEHAKLEAIDLGNLVGFPLTFPPVRHHSPPFVCPTTLSEPNGLMSSTSLFVCPTLVFPAWTI